MRTAKHQRFHNELMSMPCAVTGEDFIMGNRNQLHHCAGRAFKVCGEKVGEWFVYPLAGVIHDPRLERQGMFLNKGHRHGSGENKALFRKLHGYDVCIYVQFIEKYLKIFGEENFCLDSYKLIKKHYSNILTDCKLTSNI